MTSTHERTIRNLAKVIDTRAVWRFNGIAIPVTILDVRVVYGRTEVLISPVGGNGRRWVSYAAVYREN